MEIDHELHDEIRRAARSAARKWVGVIDAEDLEQEVWIRLLDHDYFDRWVEMDPLARRRVLRIIANQIASGERESYAVFTGQVYYGSDEVRSLLESGALIETGVDDVGATVVEIYHPSVDGSGAADLGAALLSVSNRRRVDREGSIMTLTESIDLRASYEYLTPAEKETLHDRFVMGRRPDSDAGGGQYVTRAIDALTRAMNKNYRHRADEWNRR